MFFADPVCVNSLWTKELIADRASFPLGWVVGVNVVILLPLCG
jgi:hypothetical protein